MTDSTFWARLFLIALSCVIVPISVSIAEAEVLATFAGSSEGWQNYNGEVKAVSIPSADERGGLEVAVGLSGRGWSDITVESPEIGKDLSGHGELKVSIFKPVGVPADVKVQVFAKSGPGWTWSDGGWQSLSVDQWTVITLPVADIAYPRQVRTVGVKVGGNSRFDGSVFLDRVEVGGSPGVAPPKISVRIIEIIENSRIIGRIFGIPADRVGDYKVLVYVKTDKWYVHPYERGGPGLSFASINQDGSWQIETVKRRFLADFVAALVVPNDYPAPSTVDELQQITSIASYTEEGKDRL